jgi:signal transduction histidine kinase/CheY-like chemotaxis protein
MSTTVLNPFNRYQYILSKQDEILNKARIKILALGLLSFFLLGIALLLLNISRHCSFPFRNVLLIGLFAAGLVLLLAGVSWKFMGHFFIIAITYLLWSNLTSNNSYFLVALQYILIVVAGSYYILGERWGLAYSICSIIPFTVVIVHFVQLKTVFSGDLNTNISNYIVIAFNFLLLLFIHHVFFSAFRQSNNKQKELLIDLERSLSEASEIATAKTNFLSTMSHELRTPLNAVVGMVNFMLMTNKDPEQKENLEVVQFSADNLMYTVNDILDFNKIDAGKIELDKHQFDLTELLKNIHRAFKPQAESKKIKLNCTIDAGLNDTLLIGDEARLSQVLFNLIGNAIKFTLKGHVSITAKITSTREQMFNILFKIEDTGIGIPADQHAHIFDPYTQNRSGNSRQYHGTGLGLTIAKQLVALHKSELSFFSAEGVGTVFEFELAYEFHKKEQGVLNTKEQNLWATDISMLSVLIAEDNALNVLVLKKLLNTWGIKPVVAENGLKAVEAVKMNDFDVILMDINMPIMDGFEASRQIRELKEPRKSNVHIIALSASVGTSIENHDGYKYLNDCMLKPFIPAVLKEKLDKLEIAAKMIA